MHNEFSVFLLNEIKTKEYTAIKLSGDASAREYFRIFADNKQYILCCDSCNDNFNRFILAQQFLSSAGLMVPEIYGIDRSELYILQEDLGDKSLEYGESNYHDAIDIALSFTRIPQPDRDNFLFQWSFDHEKLQTEIEMSHEYFVRRYLKNDIGEPEEETFEILIKEILAIPYVLVHRDFHSRNIHDVDGAKKIIDFQDARLGPLPYDLVSLLEDPYLPIDNIKREHHIQYFYKNYADQYTYEEFYYWYQLTAVQRLYKILGSFTYLYFEKGKDSYLQYISTAIKRLQYYTGELAEKDVRFKILVDFINGVTSED